MDHIHTSIASFTCQVKGAGDVNLANWVFCCQPGSVSVLRLGCHFQHTAPFSMLPGDFIQFDNFAPPADSELSASANSVKLC